MDATPTDVAQIAHSIQLSVAPVFLLSGIGVLLGVLTNRLARVVDRARATEAHHSTAAGPSAVELRSQLRQYARRTRLMNSAITLSTVSALLVAIVVALLFGSTFIHFNLAAPVALLFIGAMVALVGALVAFLVEVRIATLTIRIGPRDD
jgi:multidrug efflux pump subunit AcrB